MKNYDSLKTLQSYRYNLIKISCEELYSIFHHVNSDIKTFMFVFVKKTTTLKIIKSTM